MSDTITPAVSFAHRMMNLLGDFVGKPATHALVNELTQRMSKQSGVVSVVAELVLDGISLFVGHTEGDFHGHIGATKAVFKPIAVK